jgi:hypothetical protein
METWADILAQFSAVIRNGAEFTPGVMSCPHYSATRGIEVYRNNYRGNLHDTLASAYPVIRKLVAEEFFRFLTRRYIERYPSRSGNLHCYGSEMAEFLTCFENTQHLAYLPDMAQLEWAYHHAYFAKDAPAFDINRLAMVAPEAYAGLYWRLHPSCVLLTSAYPVAAIWHAHQGESLDDFHIDLDSGVDVLLVYRNGLRVDITRIASDGQHWLTQLQSGITMGAATDATLSAYPHFDLTTTLRHWITHGVLIDFNLS